MKSLARWIVFVLCWAIILSITGCRRSPSAPLNNQPANPGTTNPGLSVNVSGIPGTLYGIVYEHSAAGPQPLAGLALRVDATTTAGTHTNTTVVTDSDGRFRVADLIRDFGM